MKLVKFKDGTFGIRYGLIFHEYQDFKDMSYQWPAKHRHMIDCKTTEDEARKFFDAIVDKGEPVK